MIKCSYFEGIREGVPQVIPLFGPQDQVFEKLAAPYLLPEVQRYIDQLRPRDNAQYVLVNAMGAGEYYGSNSNGDRFSEAALVHAPDDWAGDPALDRDKAAQWPYGFPTFYGAKVFAHHRNKQAERGLGDVELAAWSPGMKRVELVTRLDKDRCQAFDGQATWDKLKSGSYADVSMGTRVPFDVCSVCLDRKTYQEAWSTFDPAKHKHPGEAILEFHKRLKGRNGVGIQGLSITRKDYCFPPGTPILLSDGTYRAIEDVAVGDSVTTHDGTPGRVLELLPREVDENLVRIYPWGMAELLVTDNHPFWSARRPCRSGSRADFLESNPPDWVAAGDLREGDIVFLPLPVVTETIQVEHSLGWLLGLYLAEGCPNFSPGVAHPKSIGFTLHGRERGYCEEIVEVARRLDSGLTFNIYPYKDRNAICLTLNSRTVAEWLLIHGGHGSLRKALNGIVWDYGKAFLYQVLRGWLEGDGSYDYATGNLRGCTSSTELALQMQRLAGACGILAAAHLNKRTSNFGYQEIWYLQFSGDAANAARAGRAQEHFERQSKLFFWGKYLGTTLRKITREVYTGPTFNFEVEGNNSYVAGGCAVHNCEHALREMNRIYPDGRKVWVDNDFPRFFDISFVFIGADKIAKTMLKIAEQGRMLFMGSAEMAEKLGMQEPEEQEKTAVLKVEAKQKSSEIQKDVMPNQLAGKAVPLMEKSEGHLQPASMRALLSQPPGQALSTVTGMGMVLKPEEFAELLGGLEELPELSGDLFSPALAQALMGELPNRSGLGPIIERRIIFISHQPEQAPAPLTTKQASLYRQYRLQALSLLAETQELLEKTGAHQDRLVQELVSCPPEQLFTPLSFQYFRTAYLDLNPTGV